MFRHLFIKNDGKRFKLGAAFSKIVDMSSFIKYS